MQGSEPEWSNPELLPSPSLINSLKDVFQELKKLVSGLSLAEFAGPLVSCYVM